MPAARAFLYVATIGALALTVRSALFTPLPLVWAILAVTAYFAVIGVGVVFLRLGMFVDVVWRGSNDARGVALTFDDGPHPVHTRKVLDLLDDAGAKGTFFVIGHKAEKYPEIIREIVDRGHAVGLHSYSHHRLFSLRSPTFVKDDLTREIDVLERATGDKPFLFRPPIGHTSPRIAKAVAALDLVVVGWSARALDGLGRPHPDAVARRLLKKLGDGAILQLHDAAEHGSNEPASVGALPRILEAMRERDLAGVRVDTWLGEENG